jgi:uncharacterized membrane protein YqaE (UPF0057 family)
MTGEFRLLPGVHVGHDLAAKSMDALMQFMQLLGGVLVLAGYGFDLRNLLLDLLEFLLRFVAGAIHFAS